MPPRKEEEKQILNIESQNSDILQDSQAERKRLVVENQLLHERIKRLEENNLELKEEAQFAMRRSLNKHPLRSSRQGSPRLHFKES